MKLSIIVPAYNVSHYIERCLYSLINQDIDQDNYEIIIVNDGSKDDTLSVVEKFMTEQSVYYISLINQANKGLAGARNTGIRHANGEYLLFVDPDDYLENNVLNRMYNIASAESLEVAMFSQRLVYLNSKIEIHRPPSSKSGIIDGFKLFQSRPGDSACKYLIKNKFLKENNLYFFEKARFLEDAEWSNRLFSKAKKCAYQDFIFYNYEMRAGSLINSNSAFSENAIQGYIFSALNLLDYKNIHCQTIEEKEFLNQGIIKFSVLPISLLASKKRIRELRKIINLLKEAGLEKLETKGVKGFRKRHGLLYNFSPTILWFYLFIKIALNSIKYKFVK